MQAQTDVPALAVGHQYRYKSSFQAFKSIVQAEGIRGLMRGAHAAALRVGVGSSVQLPLYDNSKSLILSTGLLPDNVAAHMAASLVSGVGLVIAMNPFDVVATRLYNQKVESGKGALYSGPFNCLKKILSTEGFYGLYKGVFAHYLRTGPHTVPPSHSPLLGELRSIDWRPPSIMRTGFDLCLLGAIQTARQCSVSPLHVLKQQRLKRESSQVGYAWIYTRGDTLLRQANAARSTHPPTESA